VCKDHAAAAIPSQLQLIKCIPGALHCVCCVARKTKIVKGG
jgi:hypothetical protein